MRTADDRRFPMAPCRLVNLLFDPREIADDPDLAEGNPRLGHAAWLRMNRRGRIDGRRQASRRLECSA